MNLKRALSTLFSALKKFRNFLIGSAWRGEWIALLAGALHAFSFAPWPWTYSPLGWLQLLALALLGVLLLSSATTRRAAGLGFLFGLAWFGLGVHWIFTSLHTYGGMHWALASAGVALFCIYLALYPALAAWLTVYLSKRLSTASSTADASHPFLAVFIFSFAFAWGISEWLRATLFTGFPWIASGYAHVQSALAGYLPIVGISGVNFLVALVAGLLAVASLIFSSRIKRFGAIACLAGAVALLVLGGALKAIDWTQASGKPLSVRLVQGNIAQDMKFDPRNLLEQFQRYYQMSTVQIADLIVLPETAFPVPMQHSPEGFFQALAEFAQNSGSTLITGIPLFQPRAENAEPGPMGKVDWYNGAVAITPRTLSSLAAKAEASASNLSNSSPVISSADASKPLPMLEDHHSLARYAKHHLVPFGETIPPGLAWFVNAMNMPLGEFSRGALVQTPFVVKDQRIAVNICYEDLFGNEIASTLRQPQPPTVLLNLSNIGWFGNSVALPQHLLASRARALETGRPMLRATNTGVTAVINPRGEVTQKLPVYQQATLNAQVQGYEGSTPYTRWGDAGFATLLLLTLGLMGWLKRAVKRV